MRVFRDAADLSATPALWPALTDALDRSKYVVLLASPQAARSTWVTKELQYWLSERAASEILIVLTAGEVIWDDRVGDFDWNTTTALPPSLKGIFRHEPLYVDLRGYSPDEMNLANPRFARAVASLASTISGEQISDLIGEEMRQQRHVKRIVFAAMSLILILVSMLVTAMFLLLGSSIFADSKVPTSSCNALVQS